MAIPFHRLKVCGGILVAARGASIHTFSIANGSHIAAWRVPQPASKEEEKEEGGEKEENVPPTGEAGEGDLGVPPSKRRRLHEAEEGTDEQEDHAAPAEQPRQQQNNGTANGNSNGNQKTKKNKRKAKTNAAKQAPVDPAKAQKIATLRTADLPVVGILEATADGRHIIVMMGHGKTLRVLAHDMQGHLTQLSERVMPKRPCAVAFTADGQTILSGDKFGDVYALPLIETEKKKVKEKEDVPPTSQSQPQPPAPPPPVEVVAPLRLEANQFTVHTKGNRQALENQRRQKELLQSQPQPKKDQEESEYQLLLGHVSMLTAVIVAEGILKGESTLGGRRKRRPLILTADRDEHIRVTRGIVGNGTPTTSQTHVIETFCLGHTSFVSRLCIPASRPDRLVSGGGDGELWVWDFWPEGRLVGKADLASLAAGVLPAAAATGAEAPPLLPKVALSGLYSFGSPSACDPDAMMDGDDNNTAEADAYLVAICERVPALFFFRLTADGSTLAHTQTLRLPAGQLPLDVVEVSADGGSGSSSNGHQLVVATAPAEEGTAEDMAMPSSSSSLLTLTSTKDGWSVAEVPFFVSLPPPTAADDPATATLDRTVLRRLLLHSNESLRKDNEGEE